MKSRVYDSGKPEGRHQLIQAINEAADGIKKNGMHAVATFRGTTTGSMHSV